MPITYRASCLLGSVLRFKTMSNISWLYDLRQVRTFFWTSCLRAFSMYSRSSSEIFGSSDGEFLTSKNHTMVHTTPAVPDNKWKQTRWEPHVYSHKAILICAKTKTFNHRPVSNVGKKNGLLSCGLRVQTQDRTLELNAENLGAQHMKWKVFPWQTKAPRAILWVPQATRLLLGNSLAESQFYEALIE